MSPLESLQISLFGLGTVFIVLIALSAVVSLESRVFYLFSKNKKEELTVDATKHSEGLPVVTATSGKLKLIDVDERTAAMIMAIVSDKSQIPLSELNFKCIKAID